jgi:bifunctional DNA-binding transcriptional regulator/antitoxin component of YhaV-PrlF toxin-antitoxin module
VRISDQVRVPQERRRAIDLEKGDRVIFTKDAGGIMKPFVRKGTEVR